jgi:hypothetical protein
MSRSSWGKKFEKKLSGLVDSASKDSIQTLANWIGFNRKHSAVIAEILADALKAQTGNTGRQWLYWQVVHELLLLENSNPAKWEKLQDLRTALGETTIVSVIESVPTLAPQIEDSLLKQWDQLNVFGGPTLISQMRRLLTSPREESTAGNIEASPSVSEQKAPAVASTSSPPEKKSLGEPTLKKDLASKEISGKKPDCEVAEKKESASVERRSSLSSLKQVEYDFESKVRAMKSIEKVYITFKLIQLNLFFSSFLQNVPAGKVDSRQFLEPCKAIATLQIARDLRNDAPVQLSSLLENLPEDIRNNLESEELSEEIIQEYSKRIPSKLLDLDMDEQLNNIATFQDIVTRQQKARKTLIYLLLKSRCQFGSNQAAEKFFELQKMSQKLNKRKQLLTDALELEGMDTEIDNTDLTETISNLPELSWYESEGKMVDPSKKARI